MVNNFFVLVVMCCIINGILNVIINPYICFPIRLIRYYVTVFIVFYYYCPLNFLSD